MREIFFYFLRLGALGFGGPLALISQMQRDLVTQEKWVDDESFRRTFGLIKAMPGPVAFQTAVYLAYRRRAFVGALLAGVGLVLPSFCMMILLAMFYSRTNEIPLVKAVMSGMQLGAFALILAALKNLSEIFFKRPLFWILLASGLILPLVSAIPEPVLILLFGAAAVLSLRLDRKFSFDPTLVALSVTCLKAGALVFGTGLAIVPFLEGDFVSKFGWLTHSEFMDALALGQLTPGPVVITVAFIGYKIAGLTGAALATLSVFLPAFVHMTSWFPRVQNWLGTRQWISRFTLGVTAAVCSAIMLSLWRMGQDWDAIRLAGATLMLPLALWRRVPSWAVVLFGGGYGAALL